MALERFFKYSTTLKRLQCSALWIVLDGFCQWLLDNGYSHSSILTHIQRVRCLSDYLDRRGITDHTQLTWDHIQVFLTSYLPKYRCPQGGRVGQRRRISCSIRRFAEYLVVSGFVSCPPENKLPYQAILDEYLTWLRDYCHCSAGTVEVRRRYLIPFLEWLGAEELKSEKFSKLSPRSLQNFFLDYADGCSGPKATAVANTLRNFCRFCQHHGYISTDLTPAIPSFRRYRLSGIPRGITEEDAQRLLQSIDQGTSIGLRDYAIVQLLYTYGVRGEQVSTLQLNDIQWSSGQIHFRALKHGKSVIHPLTDDVGDSLLAYLQHGRPLLSYAEVFLGDPAPHHPISRNALSWIVSHRLRAAGVQLPAPGARAFRHGFATRMLKAGYALKPIADMLGHRNIRSTSIYAKVDFQTLDRVGLEWPEEET